MRVKVLKSFPYSPDGINIRDVAEKEEFDCREDILDGLVQEGFVSIIAPKKGAANNSAADEKKAKQKLAAEAAAQADAAAHEAANAAAAVDAADTPEKKQAAETAWAALEETAKQARARSDELAEAAKA